jgi:Heparinase II/III-like protein/Heparinase II/III N-terminus
VRTALIQSIFPSARDEAASRADRILRGSYDLLGYRDVAIGAPPAWHEDPVHGLSAPMTFWADVPYLDPACGDHKIIWELNRHQHWLALGRAYHLTGDRRYYVEFVAQLESWLATNPPLVGTNWASMLEIAFRSLSWLWALHFFAPAAAGDPPDAPAWSMDLLVALDRQLAHVERNLSRYFSPNTHLTGEALALYVAGLALPELEASRRRVAMGRSVLVQEAERQVLADGGHAELSAHYHRYSTDFYLLAYFVARAAGDPAAPRFEHAARRQAEFLRTLADDSGRLPLLGDDDGGMLFPICGREPSNCCDTLATAAVLLECPELAVSDPPEETMWMCGEGALELPSLPPRAWPSRALPDSGYLVSRTANGDHLVLDTGPHGYLNGGHAHADALSVVLTVQGQPLLVDGGTATYTMDAGFRDRFRSTPMHNTVVVDGRSQAEPDGPFHWRGAAGARPSIWQFDGRADYLEGRHTAYAPFTHVRQVLSVRGFGWCVVDHLLGDGRLNADAFWHLHPDWQLHQRPGGWLLKSHGRIAGIASTAALVAVTDPKLSVHAPVYGRVVRAPCLTAPLPARSPCSVMTFVTAEPSLMRDLAVEALAVTHPAGEPWQTSAFAVRSSGSTAVLLASVERDGVPRGDVARRFWGVADVTTDARVALTITREDGTCAFHVLRGTAICERRGAVALSVQEPATRKALVP